ncbi:MAG: helix-turn-helix domain-containing protein [Spirochaetes bacterium]|nr:helix-turn-helix domain-containing protein [Spirochaetota bacterium]
MTEQETREQFVELRAQGWSFEEIAGELGISKQRLADWAREMQEEIRKRGCGC